MRCLASSTHHRQSTPERGRGKLQRGRQAALFSRRGLGSRRRPASHHARRGSRPGDFFARRRTDCGTASKLRKGRHAVRSGRFPRRAHAQLAARGSRPLWRLVRRGARGGARARERQDPARKRRRGAHGPFRRRRHHGAVDVGQRPLWRPCDRARPRAHLRAGRHGPAVPVRGWSGIRALPANAAAPKTSSPRPATKNVRGELRHGFRVQGPGRLSKRMNQTRVRVASILRAFSKRSMSSTSLVST